MSQWRSSAELHLDSVMRRSIAVTSDSYIRAVVKREAAILITRVGEAVGMRNRYIDHHKGPRLIFVSFGSRRTNRWK